MPIMKSKANLGTVEKVQNDDFWVSKHGCMRKPVLFLMTAVGLTMSTLSTQAAQVVITDLLNNVLNANNGGGNQHQGTNIYTTVDLARVTVQRSSFSGESYVVVWQGVVDKNQNPPANAAVIPGSDTTLSQPPNLVIDFATLLLNGTIPPPVNSSTIYSIAVVEITGNGNNATAHTRTSAQFGFPDLNSQLQNTFNTTTQLGQQ
jgi:hypothetical protein